MPSSSSSTSSFLRPSCLSPKLDFHSLSQPHQKTLVQLVEALAQSEAKCLALESQLAKHQSHQDKKLKKALIHLKTLQKYIHLLHQERQAPLPIHSVPVSLTTSSTSPLIPHPSTKKSSSPSPLPFHHFLPHSTTTFPHNPPPTPTPTTTHSIPLSPPVTQTSSSSTTTSSASSSSYFHKTTSSLSDDDDDDDDEDDDTQAIESELDQVTAFLNSSYGSP